MRRSNSARIASRCVGAEQLAVHIRRVLVPQAGAEEHQLGRFVERIVGAVTEPQLRLLEQQRAVVDQLRDRRRIRRVAAGPARSRADARSGSWSAVR